MFSLRGSSSSSNATAVAPATATATSSSPSPKFPIYLLPTFAIPFRSRRRRESSTITTTPAGYYHYSSSPPNADAVPSLSSTPNSSALSSPVESPPTPLLFPSSSSTEDSNSSRRSSVEPLDLTAAAKLTQTQPDTIRCSRCATDLAFSSQIVSKGFTGQFGRAFLVSAPPPAYPLSQFHQNNGKGGPGKGDLINIKIGKQETRLLVTGSHIVADIHCAICHAKVGWKYVDAKEESQKYKVGKFILETQRCVTHRSWEDVAVPAELAGIEEARRTTRDPLTALPAEKDGGAEGEAIVFDSEDEDECEDLFSGTWDPEVVAKRRRRKVNQRSTK